MLYAWRYGWFENKKVRISWKSSMFLIISLQNAKIMQCRQRKSKILWLRKSAYLNQWLNINTNSLFLIVLQCWTDCKIILKNKQPWHWVLNKLNTSFWALLADLQTSYDIFLFQSILVMFTSLIQTLCFENAIFFSSMDLVSPQLKTKTALHTGICSKKLVQYLRSH